jgi:hypothetical protein
MKYEQKYAHSPPDSKAEYHEGRPGEAKQPSREVLVEAEQNRFSRFAKVTKLSLQALSL